MEYLMVKAERGTVDMADTAGSEVMPATEEAATKALVALPVSRLPALRSSSAPAVHRRHLRTRVEELMVKFRVGDGVLVARIADISLGGFFAPSRKIIPVGTFLELSLLRPGFDEICVGGVVVDDAERRKGLAVRFEAMSPEAARHVRRLVEEQQDRTEGADPDRGIARTRLMRGSSEEPANRDEELESLRKHVALLSADNERLKAEAETGAEAEKLVGRLRIEVERLKGRGVGRSGFDVEILSDIRRDAELAWTAIARLTDAVDRLK